MIESGKLGAAETRDVEHAEQGEIRAPPGDVEEQAPNKRARFAPPMPARREAGTPRSTSAIKVKRWPPPAGEPERHRFAAIKYRAQRRTVIHAGRRRGERSARRPSEGGDVGDIRAHRLDRVRRVGRAG
jgi:hypothetical protein